MIALRGAAVLAGAGVPMTLGIAVLVATRGATGDVDGPLKTWMAAASTLGFLGAWIGAAAASRLSAQNPVVEGVVIASAPAAVAALFPLTHALAVGGGSPPAFVHAAALALPTLVAAAVAAWVVDLRVAQVR